MLAHEYGRHIQNLNGQSERPRQLREQTGPQGDSPWLELQSDCYAGGRAGNAERQVFLTFDEGPSATRKSL